MAAAAVAVSLRDAAAAAAAPLACNMLPCKLSCESPLRCAALPAWEQPRPGTNHIIVVPTAPGSLVDMTCRRSTGRVQGFKVTEVPTKPYDGQKTGTSGLRKKTKEFMQPNYLANWVQSLFNACGEEIKGKELALGGDGRYFGKEAAQIIIKLAAGQHVLGAGPGWGVGVGRRGPRGGWG